MQNFKLLTASKIADAIAEIAPEAGFTKEDIVTMLEYPPDTNMGDLAFPCFRLSKTLRMAPPKIAADLAEKTADFEFGTSAAVGGYLNFKVSNEYLTSAVLTEIEENGDKYGSSDMGKGKNVVLDYSSHVHSTPSSFFSASVLQSP